MQRRGDVVIRAFESPATALCGDPHSARGRWVDRGEEPVSSIFIIAACVVIVVV